MLLTVFVPPMAEVGERADSSLGLLLPQETGPRDSRIRSAGIVSIIGRWYLAFIMTSKNEYRFILERVEGTDRPGARQWNLNRFDPSNCVTFWAFVGVFRVRGV